MDNLNFNYGYACLNTELRKAKPPVFTSRTCRKKTFEEKGLDYAKSLAIQNLKDLLTILKWNVKNNIYFMRMSSEMFPFASHAELGYSLDFADHLLKEIGVYAKVNKIRLSMHPSHYNVLNSIKPEVVKNTIRDLLHHSEIMDRMGLGKDSVMILHGGTAAPNKKDALSRLENQIDLLPECIKDRIVLENCENNFSVNELLDISEKLLIPICVDTHHDAINPSEFDFNRVLKVWEIRGIKPKVHVSNSVPGILETDNKTARRKHSDYITFIHDKLLKVKRPIDVMFEAKMKEQAVLRFRNK